MQSMHVPALAIFPLRINKGVAHEVNPCLPAVGKSFWQQGQGQGMFDQPQDMLPVYQPSCFSIAGAALIQDGFYSGCNRMIFPES